MPAEDAAREEVRDARWYGRLHDAPGPVKCAGAPQKIAHLAADWWRRQGLMEQTRVILVLPTAAMFSQPDWAQVLEGIAAGYGIEVQKEAQLIEVDGESNTAVISDTRSGTKEEVGYDLLQATPPQSAPDWVKGTKLADPASPFGYVQVDQYTLQSPTWPLRLRAGRRRQPAHVEDRGSHPQTGPGTCRDLLDAMRGTPSSRRYDGYTSCPLVTSHSRMLLAEFDYELKPTPSIPFIDTMKPRYDRWLL